MKKSPHQELGHTKRRILLVEDEVIVSLDIKNRLTSLGYDVVGLATEGQQAVEMTMSLKPDLVLMDIMLDGEMDGIDTACELRNNIDIPVVYLTAFTDDVTLHRAKISEPFGYIIKPFEDRELHTTIEMAIYKHRLESRLLQNERWLSTTLRSIGEAVVATDTSGRIQFINPMAEKLLGWNQVDAFEKNLTDVFNVSDKNGQLETQEVLNVARGETPSSRSELKLNVRGSGSIPVELNVSPIIDPKNQFMGIVLVFRDITKRKNAEAALRRSVSELRRTLQETVNALAATSEKRDPYTAGHQQRVAQLSWHIAKYMGFDEDQLQSILISGRLHDIGKIYVPAEILSKPAILTSMEMGIMKSHSEVGYDILKNVPFPWEIAKIVLQHHERINGTGYPHGLFGTDILPEARVIAVADVVEAMSSHRPYRAALGLHVALDEITKNRGNLYDADIVDACLHLFNEYDFSFDDDRFAIPSPGEAV
ncbi:HD domain-containing phosphohydrolase [Desulfovibrio inopinatus]|uniref:HD domain-containing phosphohydrolase n=1 Tax=Desulfovibrio inopinatus TaxID=102109 RepID=UPI0003F7B9AA|nr:HD domain-containing phosphohydrolase [Desulfovibrio inopinatus]